MRCILEFYHKKLLLLVEAVTESLGKDGGAWGGEAEPVRGPQNHG